MLKLPHEIEFDLHNVIMASNFSCVTGHNSTDHCKNSQGSPLALVVSLPIIFIVVGIVIAAIFYLRHKKLKDTTESEKAKSTDQDLAVASGSPYTRYIGHNQPTPCSPIYENYQHRNTELSSAHQPPFHRGQTDRSHCPPDELYIQCDTSEAIYSNDPGFFQPHTENSEDLYILPDS
ncbi:hypothetical protein AOLI_G00218040 [Acnodon oligacanthus]